MEVAIVVGKTSKSRKWAISNSKQLLWKRKQTTVESKKRLHHLLACSTKALFSEQSNVIWFHESRPFYPKENSPLACAQFVKWSFFVQKLHFDKTAKLNFLCQNYKIDSDPKLYEKFEFSCQKWIPGKYERLTHCELQVYSPSSEERWSEMIIE